uniref:RING-type E3 ubiquitin transferase n=1 Tax=Haptolina brevifila TaxID=156173 RepID=A0A7S2MEP6_9EUKA|mmetsp:Transcript_509/g.1023  ORF Transcript_509/g.1023 Transcript_509/m.1023 type:complete len:209 (+) Transcript_509:1010-1636(+)
MMDAGWPPLSASIVQLLLGFGAAAIGRSIHQRSAELSASTHALTNALRVRAWAISTPAPPTYASLRGSFGLATADPAWEQLLNQEGVQIGHSFVTSAPIQASIHPTRLPELINEGPVHRIISATCELRLGAPIVRFESEDSEPSDVLRTFIQTSPIGYALPPLATITLLAILEPGTFALTPCCTRTEPEPGGLVDRRRCFCVSVSVPC